MAELGNSFKVLKNQTVADGKQGFMRAFCAEKFTQQGKDCPSLPSDRLGCPTRCIFLFGKSVGSIAAIAAQNRAEGIEVITVVE